MLTRRGVASGLSLVMAVSASLGCSGRLLANPDDRADYLRFVSFEGPGHEHVLLHWPREKMPLKVYLPRPPNRLFDDPDAMWTAAREGVSRWTDAASPGLPGFVFVDSAPEADIPIAWAQTSGYFSVAHCFYHVDVLDKRFGVAQIVVTGRYRDGTPAPLDFVREVVTHEMGHALGLAGHSPNREDAMYGFGAPDHANLPKAIEAQIPKRVGEGLSQRDRETLRLLYERPVGARNTDAARAY